MIDRHALAAATFLVEALDLETSALELARGIVWLRRDAWSGVCSIELDSSVGPAAFLIYDYELNSTNAAGVSMYTQFDADLRTLERAAELNTPGPRILAHATIGETAFILATTPSVHRALTGAGGESLLEATEADLLPGAGIAEMRAEAASDLMDRLREADAAAERWLRAFRAEGNVASDSTSDFIEFGEAEAALALFLMDERSIQHLLQAFNLFISSARDGDSPGPASA
jgi:hypothetical protein